MFSYDGCVCYCDDSWLGAKVGIRCQDRKTMDEVFYTEGVTDSTGTYNIMVENDHHDNICKTVLVSSPIESCNTPDPGRNRSSIVLTHYKNGVLNHLHYANAMGYLKADPLPQYCHQLLKYYLSDSDVWSVTIICSVCYVLFTNFYDMFYLLVFKYLLWTS